MRSVLSFLWFFLCFTRVLGQLAPVEEKELADSLLAKRGECYLQLFGVTRAEKYALYSQVSVDRIAGDTLVINVNKQEFGHFLDLEIPFKVMQPPSMEHHPRELKPAKKSGSWNFYPTYQEYLDSMYSLADRYQGICQLYDIGSSVKGKKLLFLKISDKVTEDENEPGFMYSSSMHGDELTGYVLMLRLAEYLLENYQVDSAVTKLVDNLVIWINPLANPDGAYAESDTSVHGATRRNANGVDLNRNFPDPGTGEPSFGYEIQPENVAMIDFIDSRHFHLSANIHGGEEVINYPWDTWQRRHADDDWFYFISRQYADTVHEYAPLTYLSGFDKGVTNGYDWYTIDGGRQDYMTYFHRGREVTMEISKDKTPPSADLDNYWEWNHRSLLNYMEQAAFGLSGRIYDSATGMPIIANVFITGHDEDNSDVYSDSTGFYARYLKEGEYQVTYQKDGYISSVKSIQITDMEKVKQDVYLPRVPVIAPEKDSLLIYPNPFIDQLTLYLSSSIGSENLDVSVYSLQGTLVYKSSKSIPGTGEFNYTIDLAHLPSGVYHLTVRFREQLFTAKIVKVNK